VSTVRRYVSSNPVFVFEEKHLTQQPRTQQPRTQPPRTQPPRSPHLRDIIRTLKLVGRGLTVAELAQELVVAEELIVQDLQFLHHESLVVQIGLSQHWMIASGDTEKQRLNDLLKVLDAEQILAIANRSEIDVIGRLGWIEDAFAIIGCARTSYRRKVSRLIE